MQGSESLLREEGGLQVIHTSLFRMGTNSLATAYRMLGYTVFHGLDDMKQETWSLIEEAAEATWPSAPDARPRPPFARADWDRLWGARYDIVTDHGGPFAAQLISAYPAAKVVIVQRDFDEWWPSFRSQLLDPLFSPRAQPFIFLGWHVLGIRAGHAMRKEHFGFFGARSRAEIEANARATYDSYFETVRRLVPEERRLEYALGDGWEPLCTFLGKDVPDVPFPHTNNRKLHSEEHQRTVKSIYLASANRVMPWIAGAAAVALAGWYTVQS
ncbi:hypothetical protein DL769_001333 [Monosporascus sp. CRB-8-3]|nr:hypothetical protein DL769_001333 [Monosporascus sp. CRB-8-3]